MKQSKEMFIEQYIDYSIKLEKSLFEKSSKMNRKYARKINKLIETNENEDYYIEALSELIDNDNLRISSGAAIDSLKHNCNIDKAVRRLEEISSREDTYVVGFAAGIILQRWREKGADGIQ